MQRVPVPRDMDVVARAQEIIRPCAPQRIMHVRHISEMMAVHRHSMVLAQFPYRGVEDNLPRGRVGVVL
jgi:hypothetical protein